MTITLPDFYRISPEVCEALAENRPIVALESSVVTGGKWPSNAQIALAVEQAIRDHGALPARIAVLKGRLYVGLSKEETEVLSQFSDSSKIGTRDLAWALATGKSAGTTVSASLIACQQVGIKVFSVAGIGGVHYGATETLDISTDLIQFTRSKVAVVCAGAKSMLDPALTLEYLETHGVPVIGYRWSDFPGYYTRSTSEKVPLHLEYLSEIASLIEHHWKLASSGGVLVTHPLNEEDSLDSVWLNGLIQDAVKWCRENGIRGQAVTPEILKIISTATEGKSEFINRSALISTAVLAAKLASHLSDRIAHDE